jgi:hypothetical protein
MRRPASYRGAIIGFVLLFITCGIAYFSWPRPSNVASAPVKARPQDLGDTEGRLDAAKAPIPQKPKRPSQAGGNELSTEIDDIQLHEQDFVPPPEPEPLPPNLIANREQQAVDGLPNPAAKRQENGGGPEIRRDPNRFFGDWDNPFLQSKLKLGRRSWIEEPNNGGPPMHGELYLFADGSFNLQDFGEDKVLVLRLFKDVLACQEKNLDGAWIKDGYLRFKPGCDWEAKNLKAAPVTAMHRHQLAGEWQHPNHETKYFVQGRDWIERAKIGGPAVIGKWEPLNDGSFVVNLDNQHRRRVWVVEENLLAILPLDQTGKMLSDGVLVLKE